MILSDFHTHTSYCDGKNTPEEMVLSAINLGMEEIGISTHSYTSFDESYCIDKNGINGFIEEIHSLKEKYKDKIAVYAGVEQDYFSDCPTDGFDYVIGSVHYVKKNGEFLTIDHKSSILIENVNKHYNGDFYAMAEDYYSLVSDVYNKTKCDIIGHFDLISKFNKDFRLFDEENPKYVSAYKTAIDNLIKCNKPFEVNTGAISRGYKNTPYPNDKMIEYIKNSGGRLVMMSDAHSADGIMYQFDKWEAELKKLGIDNAEYKIKFGDM